MWLVDKIHARWSQYKLVLKKKWNNVMSFSGETMATLEILGVILIIDKIL